MFVFLRPHPSHPHSSPFLSTSSQFTLYHPFVSDPSLILLPDQLLILPIHPAIHSSILAHSNDKKNSIQPSASICPSSVSCYLALSPVWLTCLSIIHPSSLSLSFSPSCIRLSSIPKSPSVYPFLHPFIHRTNSCAHRHSYVIFSTASVNPSSHLTFPYSPPSFLPPIQSFLTSPSPLPCQSASQYLTSPSIPSHHLIFPHNLHSFPQPIHSPLSILVTSSTVSVIQSDPHITSLHLTSQFSFLLSTSNPLLTLYLSSLFHPHSLSSSFQQPIHYFLTSPPPPPPRQSASHSPSNAIPSIQLSSQPSFLLSIANPFSSFYLRHPLRPPVS